MTAHLKAFLQFMRLNRNASVHTVRAYESDLSQFLADVAAHSGTKVADLGPAALDRHAIRRFVGELHQRGLSRASAARKLAAVRTFLRYLRREEIIGDDPGALVPTPKREVRMPAHLSEDEMGALLDAAQMLYLATRAGAEALGLENETGDFETGKAADVVYIRPPENTPLAAVLERVETPEQALAAIFTLAGSESVREVRVEGSIVYKGSVVYK